MLIFPDYRFAIKVLTCKACWIRSESQTEEPYTSIDRVGVDTPGP